MRPGLTLTLLFVVPLVACEVVPDLEFASPDASAGDAGDPEAAPAPSPPRPDAAVDDAQAIAEGGDPFDAATIANDADNPDAPGPVSVDSQPNTCPSPLPPNVSFCCGRVPCVSPNAKGCQDNCNACRAACGTRICCVHGQHVSGCADTTDGCGN